MKLARLSVNNPVTVNTIMVTVIILGLLSLSRLPREYLPDLTFNIALVLTNYPGTAPEEVEKLITNPIEEKIKNVDNINYIISTSGEGQSAILIRFDEMSDDDFKIILQDLRAAVNEVRDLPEEADDTRIASIETGEFLPSLQVTLTGDLPEKELKEFADEFKDRLLEIDHIGKLEMTGARDREIWVNVESDRLYSYGLSIEQIALALKETNFNLPGGTLEIGNSEYLIRTIGEFSSPKEIEDVIVRPDPSGNHVKIGQVAHVEDTFKKIRTLAFFNRKPGISFTISKKKKGSTIAIVDQIKAISKEFKESRLPPGCDVIITNDSSIQIRDSINKLGSNALMGIVFVSILLCLFIGWRNALFAAIGIPVSLMASFLFMESLGLSLNTSSLFALMMVVGIIVDDAIVIIENCDRYAGRGMPTDDAAVRGTTEVLGPVFTACLTTVAAFLPLMLMTDIIGKFLRVVPIVVCLALAASLLEAFLILPCHIADWSKQEQENKTRKKAISRLKDIYSKQLKFVLRFRYYFVGGIFVLFLGASSLLAFRVIDVDMYTMDEISQFYVNVELTEGAKFENTNRIMESIERRLSKALPENIVRSFVTQTGLLITDEAWVFSSNVGNMMIDLVEPKERDISIDEVIRLCRNTLQDIPGYKNISFMKLRAGPPVSADVEIKVVGKYLKVIKKISEEIMTKISVIPGIYDVKDDLAFGKKDLKIYVDEDKAAIYGLDLFKVAATIRNAFEGTVATVYREGDEEIDVIVKYDPEKVKDVDDLNNLKIRSPAGQLIPFSNVGKIRFEPGYTKIKHYKLERAASVTASIDKELNSTVKVNNTIREITRPIMNNYPGYRLRFEGAFREMNEAFSSLYRLFALSIFLIYIILGAQFKSYTQPFIILLTVPFAFIGAIMSLILTNDPFSIVVLYGFIGLAGIAVNDAIVMISFINNARKSGAARWKSIIQSGRLRLRPIILTSVTTMFGILPLALGLGGKSKIWAPMANTLFWGLAFATLLTLFILPSVYTIIVDDFGNWWKKRK